jgi:hypothetical protein
MCIVLGRQLISLYTVYCSLPNASSTNTATQRIKSDVAGHPVKTAVLPDTRPSPNSLNAAEIRSRSTQLAMDIAGVGIL